MRIFYSSKYDEKEEEEEKNINETKERKEEKRNGDSRPRKKVDIKARRSLLSEYFDRYVGYIKCYIFPFFSSLLLSFSRTLNGT